MIEDSIRQMIRDEVHATLIGREAERETGAAPCHRVDLASLTVLAEDIRDLMERIGRGTLSRDEQIGVLYELNDLEHAINECRIVVLVGLMEGGRL